MDNLEVAQLISLLLNNGGVRQAIDKITLRVVLILGSAHSAEQKAVLDAIRYELRRHNYIPVLLDSAKPTGWNLTETISILAHMAQFIIVDITEAKSIAQELQAKMVYGMKQAIGDAPIGVEVKVSDAWDKD